MQQLDLVTPAMELEAAKQNPEGQELSPAAQALCEREGAARFGRHHPALAAHPAWPFKSAAPKGGA